MTKKKRPAGKAKSKTSKKSRREDENPTDVGFIPVVIDGLKNQCIRLVPIILLTAGLGLIGMAVVYLMHLETGAPFSVLTRDMASVCHVKPFIGFLSNIGIIIWSGSAASCFLAALFLRQGGNKRRFVQFFSWFALFTLLLALDDVLVLHETFFPRTLHLSQTVIYSIYASLTLLSLLVFLREILTTDFLLLLIAGGFLSASMVTDQFMKMSDLETLFEDTLKFFGIIFWLVYFIRTALVQMKNSDNPDPIPNASR